MTLGPTETSLLTLLAGFVMAHLGQWSAAGVKWLEGKEAQNAWLKAHPSVLQAVDTEEDAMAAAAASAASVAISTKLSAIDPPATPAK